MRGGDNYACRPGTLLICHLIIPDYVTGAVSFKASHHWQNNRLLNGMARQSRNGIRLTFASSRRKILEAHHRSSDCDTRKAILFRRGCFDRAASCIASALKLAFDFRSRIVSGTPSAARELLPMPMSTEARPFQPARRVLIITPTIFEDEAPRNGTGERASSSIALFSAVISGIYELVIFLFRLSAFALCIIL